MTGPATERLAWHEQGACAGTDPELFFPDSNRGGFTDARRLCRRCPVQLLCLQQAMEDEQGQGKSTRHGMWGGLTPRQRADLDRRQRGEPSQRHRGGGLPPAPYGTRGAYDRHRRRGEDIDPACAAAYAEYRRRRRKTKAAA